jgi:outer membrane lipoprotein SlyB
MAPNKIDSRFLVPKDKVIKELQAIPEQYTNNLTEYQSVVNKVESAVKTLTEKFGKEITLEDLNKIKREMWENAYSRNNTDVINDVAYEIGNRMKGFIEKAIPAMKKFNKEYGMVIAAKRALFKATTRPEIGLIGKGVSTAASGTIGGLIGGPMGAAAGTIAGPQIGELVAGTAARTYLGAGLRSAANVIQKIPTDKMGNLQIGKKALISLIKNSGKENVEE